MGDTHRLTTAGRLALIECQCADQLRYLGHVVTLEIVGDTLVDGRADQRVVEQCGADTDGAGACDDEFDGILGTGNTALSDDRDGVVAADLVD